MIYYILRIDFQSTQQSDYENLHRALVEKGFSSLIRGSDGRYFKLPKGEYSIASDLKAGLILALADTAAATLGKTIAALVTGGVCAWSGLPEVGDSVVTPSYFCS